MTTLHGTFQEAGDICWSSCPTCGADVNGYEPQVERSGWRRRWFTKASVVEPCGCTVEVVQVYS